MSLLLLFNGTPSIPAITGTIAESATHREALLALSALPQTGGGYQKQSTTYSYHSPEPIEPIRIPAITGTASMVKGPRSQAVYGMLTYFGRAAQTKAKHGIYTVPFLASVHGSGEARRESGSAVCIDTELEDLALLTALMI